ncbi:MAG: YceD family protein [Acidimicrobiales bacterium]
MTDDETLDTEVQPNDDQDHETTPARIVVNVADLRRRLGQRRVEPIEVRLAQQRVVGSRTTSESVRGEVIVESIERGVSTLGRVSFTWEGDCRRCLELTGGRLEIDIAEIFQIDAPDDSELIKLEGDQIDLVPVVRDAVLLSLPLVPLCRDDCAGPDPDRYPAMTVAEIEQLKAAETADTPDPRWAALEQLRLEDN